MGQSYRGHLWSCSDNICQCFSGILFLSKTNAFKQYSDVEIGIFVLWHKGFISIFKSAWIVFDNIFYCFVRQIIYPLFVVSKILCWIICVNHWDEDIKIWRDWCTKFVTSFEICSSGDPAKVFTEAENWDLKSLLCTVQCISSII